MNNSKVTLKETVSLKKSLNIKLISYKVISNLPYLT